MRISQGLSKRASPGRSGETAILFNVGGFTFAIAAIAVEEIRDLAGLRDFSFGRSHHKLEKVKHVFERQGRDYFVIDAATHFHLEKAQTTRLMVLRDIPAAVSVDGIEGMQEIDSIQGLPTAFSGEEREWYRGLALINVKVVPVVRSDAFLTKAQATLLNAWIRTTRAGRGVAVTA
jgi:chemotaxis signal transduction protein